MIVYLRKEIAHLRHQLQKKCIIFRLWEFFRFTVSNTIFMQNNRTFKKYPQGKLICAISSEKSQILPIFNEITYQFLM